MNNSEEIVLDDSSVHKCIDMSKIKQPLFSDWPPIKLKSKSVVIPKNPSVPNKHELFKIPRSVTNLWKNPHYDPLSYKTKIPLYQDIADLLFDKKVTESELL